MGNTETKVTGWIECQDGLWYPSLQGGGSIAYRIWQQFDGFRWFQRHEWKFANGDTAMGEWIRGATGWCRDASPALEVEA